VNSIRSVEGQLVLTQHNLSDSPETETDEGIDFHIGQRLRGLRVARGLSQAEVAAKVNLSFQQIQKYESGKSRVTAAKLCSLAQALEIPVGFFFEDRPLSGQPGAAMPNGLSEKAWLLAGQFDRIENPKTQAKVLALVKALTEE
jgi:transcriptional regulator with XRE-family HTH domain